MLGKPSRRVWADRQRHHSSRKKLVTMVTTKTPVDRGEPVLLIDTHQKLVASSVGEKQCSKAFLKIKFNKSIIGPKELREVPLLTLHTKLLYWSQK